MKNQTSFLLFQFQANGFHDFVENRFQNYLSII